MICHHINCNSRHDFNLKVVILIMERNIISLQYFIMCLTGAGVFRVVESMTKIRFEVEGQCSRPELLLCTKMRKYIATVTQVSI